MLRLLRRSSLQPLVAERADWISAIDTHGATLTFITCAGWKIGDSISVAATFRSRRRGLLHGAPLSGNEGLLLSPGGSIHTFGMRYPIDVIFLDDQLEVLKCMPCLKPWRVVLAPRRTSYVLELAAGRSVATRLQVGSLLFWLQTRKAEVHDDFVKRRIAHPAHDKT